MYIGVYLELYCEILGKVVFVSPRVKVTYSFVKSQLLILKIHSEITFFFGREII